MFVLKACPKCHGDLLASSRRYTLSDEAEVSCLQCGYDMRPADARRLLAHAMRAAQPAYALAQVAS